jgi:hypothetical protein
MLLRSTHFTTPRAKKPRKKLIPETLRAEYADVVAKPVELRRQGMTHAEVCEELNRLGYRTRTGKPWHHPAQIIKLLRSFDGQDSR